jgi:hypothetical protein
VASFARRLAPRRLVLGAACAALAVSGSASACGAVIAPPWTPTEEHCSNDGACATFRCSGDGDHCTRISDWRFSADRHRGYYYSAEPRWATQDQRTIERCTAGGLCATYRCNVDGDDCVRMTDWRHRR